MIEEEIVKHANEDIDGIETISDQTDNINFGTPSAEVKLARNGSVAVFVPDIHYEMFDDESDLPEMGISEDPRVDQYPSSIQKQAEVSDSQLEPQSSLEDDVFIDKSQESHCLKRNRKDRKLVKQPEFEYEPREGLTKLEDPMDASSKHSNKISTLFTESSEMGFEDEMLSSVSTDRDSGISVSSYTSSSSERLSWRQTRPHFQSQESQSSVDEFDIKDPRLMNRRGSKRKSAEMTDISLSLPENFAKGVSSVLHEDEGKLIFFLFFINFSYSLIS